jgi:hypothetical protein
MLRMSGAVLPPVCLPGVGRNNVTLFKGGFNDRHVTISVCVAVVLKDKADNDKYNVR